MRPSMFANKWLTACCKIEHAVEKGDIFGIYGEGQIVARRNTAYKEIFTEHI